MDDYERLKQIRKHIGKLPITLRVLCSQGILLNGFRDLGAPAATIDDLAANIRDALLYRQTAGRPPLEQRARDFLRRNDRDAFTMNAILQAIEPNPELHHDARVKIGKIIRDCGWKMTQPCTRGGGRERRYYLPASYQAY